MGQKKFLLALWWWVSSVGVVAAQTGRPADQAAATVIERGNRSFAKEDYQAALREYASVPASAGETYSQALYNMGVSYYELWRTREAIDSYRHAIRARHGHYPRALYALGVALENQGSWQKLKRHTNNQ